MTSESEKIETVLFQLKQSCTRGRKLIIVIGSGMSADVGAPEMKHIHGYLLKHLPEKADTDAIRTIRGLLRVPLWHGPIM